MRHGIRLIGAVALLLALGQTMAQPAQAQSFVRNLKPDGGFQEVVICVPEIEPAIAFYQKVAGWHVIYRGAADPDMMHAWGMPDSAKAVEAVLQEGNNPTGLVRLIRFRGVTQEEVRPSAHPWDTGGIASLVVRVHDVRAKYAQFLTSGWSAYTEPVQVIHPNQTVLATMMEGFGGEVLTLSQPLSPAADGPKDVGAPSTVVTAAKDFDATVAFYTDKLGFKIVHEEEGPVAPQGPNILGLPFNLAGNVYERVVDLHPLGPDPAGSRPGVIEVTTFYGADGADFSPRARLPNLGTMIVRFPVSDAVGKAEALKAKGIALQYDPTPVGMSPYGAVKVFGLRDPNGVWIEFFEAQEKP